VEQRSRNKGEFEPEHRTEVRHTSHVRPALQEDRIPTTRIDLSELAKLTAEAAKAADPVTPLASVVFDLAPNRVPRLRIPRQELMGMDFDRGEAFLVSLLDDVSTVGMLVDVAGMPEEQVMAALVRLQGRGIIDIV
jgi:hypothetical protein